MDARKILITTGALILSGCFGGEPAKEGCENSVCFDVRDAALGTVNPQATPILRVEGLANLWNAMDADDGLVAWVSGPSDGGFEASIFIYDTSDQTVVDIPSQKNHVRARPIIENGAVFFSDANLPSAGERWSWKIFKATSEGDAQRLELSADSSEYLWGLGEDEAILTTSSLNPPKSPVWYDFSTRILVPIRCGNGAPSEDWQIENVRLSNGSVYCLVQEEDGSGMIQQVVLRGNPLQGKWDVIHEANMDLVDFLPLLNGAMLITNITDTWVANPGSEPVQLDEFTKEISYIYATSTHLLYEEVEGNKTDRVSLVLYSLESGSKRILYEGQLANLGERALAETGAYFMVKTHSAEWVLYEFLIPGRV